MFRIFEVQGLGFVGLGVYGLGFVGEPREVQVRDPPDTLRSEGPQRVESFRKLGLWFRVYRGS